MTKTTRQPPLIWMINYSKHYFDSLPWLLTSYYFRICNLYPLFFRAGDIEAKKSDDPSQAAPKAPSTETAAKLEVPSSTSKSPQNNEYTKGVVFYLNKEGRVVGILLWNLFNRISIARRILAQDVKYDDLNEVAKLFDIHEQQNADTSN